MKEEKRKSRGGVVPTSDEAPAPLHQPGETLIAKKNFEINHNGYQRKIEAGDDLTDVPEMYHANLRTEGVL
jgi:hypothetical protein